MDLSKISDRNLLGLARACSEKHDVYEPCTEEEYNAADSMDQLFEYRRKAIYNTGIMGIMQGAEPVGYRYERRVPGKELWLIFDKDVFNELRKRKLINEKGEIQL